MIAALIRILHVVFIAWMVYAPFSSDFDMVLLHSFIAPFLMLHWITNNGDCALTMLEKHVRGLEHDHESFIHKLVAPVYVIDDSSLKKMVFGSTLVLWCISVSRVYTFMQQTSS